MTKDWIEQLTKIRKEISEKKEKLLSECDFIRACLHRDVGHAIDKALVELGRDDAIERTESK